MLAAVLLQLLRKLVELWVCDSVALPPRLTAAFASSGAKTVKIHRNLVNKKPLDLETLNLVVDVMAASVLIISALFVSVVVDAVFVHFVLAASVVFMVCLLRDFSLRTGCCKSRTGGIRGASASLELKLLASTSCTD